MRHLLCTDIARDGMLAGPNISLYQHLSALLPGVAVQAPAASVTWPMWPRPVPPAAAARSGKALLEQRMDLAEALAC
jgi:phosphoribosylformimino-5-aminoimidazole carboxamide ribotide isomerase